MTQPERDDAIRAAAFAFLAEQAALHGEVLPARVLRKGFEFEGGRIVLMGQTGIFKPAAMDLPLSIRTAPIAEGKPRPYEDEMSGDGVLYKYRGTNPDHWDNRGLRQAMELQKPLVYLFGVAPGEYIAEWPAYIVDDDPRLLTFTVAFSGSRELAIGDLTGVSEPARAYVTRLTRQRLHQAAFRIRVLRAYQERCAICRLKRRELLDAAHILPDTDPRGAPVVPNGLAMCKLHHAAFDMNIVGVRPDLVVEVRRDVLDEVDGPMLIHGLQGFQGARLVVPRRPQLRPNVEFLEERYERFREAG